MVWLHFDFPGEAQFERENGDAMQREWHHWIARIKYSIVVSFRRCSFSLKVVIFLLDPLNLLTYVIDKPI